jgi:hypothetical protein
MKTIEVFYHSLLCALLLFSCASTNKSRGAATESLPVTDYAVDVLGGYYGSGKLWEPGDVKDVEITLSRDDEKNDPNALIATITATLPEALRVMGGRQTFYGRLTVSPNYELTGTVKLFIFNLTVKDSSVDPKAHTLILNFSGTAMGHPLNFELSGGPPVDNEENNSSNK